VPSLTNRDGGEAAGQDQARVQVLAPQPGSSLSSICHHNWLKRLRTGSTRPHTEVALTPYSCTDADRLRPHGLSRNLLNQPMHGLPQEYTTSIPVDVSSGARERRPPEVWGAGVTTVGPELVVRLEHAYENIGVLVRNRDRYHEILLSSRLSRRTRQHEWVNQPCQRHLIGVGTRKCRLQSGSDPRPKPVKGVQVETA
jgi:hypothetical protein